MRWKGRRQSSRVEDRRGKKPRAAIGGVGAIVVVLVLAWLTGTDPSQLLDVLEETQVSVQPGPGSGGSSTGGSPQENELAELVSVVLADTEETWVGLFPELGRRYDLPTLVLFTDAVQSACGYNSAAVGPFYCPADGKVYIDLGFFGQLDRRFGAPGDFAQAYVVAHEVGHHVQNLLGISDDVHRRQQRVGRAAANDLSVRLELQADCFAGVWGHYANRDRRLLEPGDVEEGLAAAAAIGDDTLQRRAGAAVAPESWTHGSSDQRARWLRRGLESGELARCDTFGAAGG